MNSWMLGGMNLIMYVTGIFILAYMIWFYRNARLPEEPDLTYLNQITEDWNTLPFVSMKVVLTRNSTGNLTEACPIEYPSEVFYHVWPGTYYFCDCIDGDGQHYL